MKRALLIVAALSALTLPALAQQSATGSSAGGPARVGAPGQIGGGVPGTQPGVVGQRVQSRAMMKKRMPHRRRMKRM